MFGWHYTRYEKRNELASMRYWLLNLWTDYDKWALGDPEVCLDSVRVCGLVFERGN